MRRSAEGQGATRSSIEAGRSPGELAVRVSLAGVEAAPRSLEPGRTMAVALPRKVYRSGEEKLERSRGSALATAASSAGPSRVKVTFAGLHHAGTAGEVAAAEEEEEDPEVEEEGDGWRKPSAYEPQSVRVPSSSTTSAVTC